MTNIIDTEDRDPMAEINETKNPELIQANNVKKMALATLAKGLIKQVNIISSTYGGSPSQTPDLPDSSQAELDAK